MSEKGKEVIRHLVNILSGSPLIQSDTGQRAQSTINTTGHTTVLSAGITLTKFNVQTQYEASVADNQLLL